ncbi:MAG: hypothetical protein ACT4P6_14140 [Gemmatimonadaceae bacterium]
MALTQGFGGTAMVTMSGARGLFIADVASHVAIGLDRMLVYEPVKPGQDTVIAQTVSNLPRNADVKTCRATLLVGGPSALRLASTASVPTKTDISIKGPDNSTKNYEVEVAAPARPRNVTLRLDGGDVFFRYGDVLANERYDLPDFAAHVNAFLDRYQGGTPITLRFLLTSDAEGSVDVEMGQLTSTRIQTQTWTNAADGTASVDRSLDLDYGDVRDIEMLPLPADDSKRRLIAVSVDVTGDFGPERSLGDASLSYVGTEFASVDADFGAAQSLRPGIDVQCVALALLLGTTKPASVYAALYADADGQPDLAKPALGETQVAVESTDAAPRWSYAELQAPVTLRADEVVWIVCRGIQGEAQLAVSRVPLSLLDQLRVSRGGNIWRPLSHSERAPARGLVRPIYTPGAENGVAAATLVFRSATSGSTFARVPLDPTAQSQTVRVPLTGVQDNEGVQGEIQSSARGTLTLTSLIQEYE